MQKLVDDVQIYVLYYSYLPPWLIEARYAFSWFQRIVGILIGTGLLAQKDIARKMGIVLGCFTTATIYWKHPYEAFKIHTAYLDKHYGILLSLLGLPTIKFSSLAMVSSVAHCALDIIFWGIFIYFFTRPSVKSQFKLKS